jgi:hypothetical protein
MEIVALDVDASHFVIADLNAFLIEVAIEIAGDRKAVFSRGGADQLDDDLVADQRLAAPALRDIGKETVLSGRREGCPSRPPTPPCVRVRTRRFERSTT